jgi:O-methyltransferase involved in polyketide biosynthesis
MDCVGIRRQASRRAGKRGISLERKSLFIWEGVSMYLEEEAVREILRTIASNAARGSSLVMDFAEQAMLDLLGKFSQLSQHNYTTKWGEPWIFGVPDNEEQKFFQECGSDRGSHLWPRRG